MSETEARVRETRTLMPGDIQIESADVQGVLLVAMVDGDDVTVLADRSLTSSDRHYAMELLRARLAEQATPWPRQIIFWRGRSERSDVDARVAFSAVPLDTKVERGESKGETQKLVGEVA